MRTTFVQLANVENIHTRVENNWASPGNTAEDLARCHPLWPPPTHLLLNQSDQWTRWKSSQALHVASSFLLYFEFDWNDLWGPSKDHRLCFFNNPYSTFEENVISKSINKVYQIFTPFLVSIWSLLTLELGLHFRSGEFLWIGLCFQNTCFHQSTTKHRQKSQTWE